MTEETKRERSKRRQASCIKIWSRLRDNPGMQKSEAADFHGYHSEEYDNQCPACSEAYDRRNEAYPHLNPEVDTSLLPMYCDYCPITRWADVHGNFTAPYCTGPGGRTAYDEWGDAVLEIAKQESSLILAENLEDIENIKTKAIRYADLIIQTAETKWYHPT